MTNSKSNLRSSSSVADLKDKLSQAVSGGFMGKDISDLLIDGLDDQTVMATVQATSPDDLDTEEAILLTFILDESSSMSPHRDLVTASIRSIIADLNSYKQSDSMLVSGWAFNTQPRLMFAHKKIADVAKNNDFDAYSPSGMTAEYDAVKGALTSARTYAQDLMDNGYRVRLITVVFTDGEDNSSRATTSEVKKLSQALVQEEIAVLALVGFKGYDQFSPQKVADDIGFLNVLELDFTDSAAVHASIKKMTGMLSASVIRASQTTVKASQNSFFS